MVNYSDYLKLLPINDIEIEPDCCINKFIINNVCENCGVVQNELLYYEEENEERISDDIKDLPFYINIKGNATNFPSIKKYHYWNRISYKEKTISITLKNEVNNFLNVLNLDMKYKNKLNNLYKNYYTTSTISRRNEIKLIVFIYFYYLINQFKKISYSYLNIFNKLSISINKINVLINDKELNEYEFNIVDFNNQILKEIIKKRINNNNIVDLILDYKTDMENNNEKINLFKNLNYNNKYKTNMKNIFDLINSKENELVDDNIKKEVLWYIFNNPKLVKKNIWCVFIEKYIKDYCVWISTINKKSKDFNEENIFKFNEERIERVNLTPQRKKSTLLNYNLVEYKYKTVKGKKKVSKLQHLNKLADEKNNDEVICIETPKVILEI